MKHIKPVDTLKCVLCMILLLLAGAALGEDTSFLVLPEGTVEIEDEAFCGDRSITSIVLPEGVKSIGYKAFGDNENLIEVIFPISSSPELLLMDEEALAGSDNAIIFRGNILFYKKEKDSVTITNYKPGSSNELTIPQTICGLPVKTIGEGAFEDLLFLEKLVLPEGLTTISDEAFKNCESLGEIYFPSTLESIGKSAFEYCGLSCDTLRFYLPDHLKSIAGFNINEYDGSFDRCNALLLCGKTSETAAVLTDGDYAYTCAGEEDFLYRYEAAEEKGETGRRVWLVDYRGTAEEVSIPAGIQGIKVSIYTYTVGSKVYSIGVYTAFRDNKTVRKVTIPEGTIYIDASSFGNAENLEKVILPSSGLIRLEETALSNSEKASLSGGNVLMYKKEDNQAVILSYSGSASEVTVPSTIHNLPVRVISEGAFKSCNTLTKLVLPEGIDTIGDQAFADNENLKEIVFSFSDLFLMPAGALSGSDSAVLSGANILLWDQQDDCAVIEKFYGTASEVTVPAAISDLPVRGIAGGAFRKCVSLTKVSLPEGIAWIDSLAFADNEKLKEVAFASSSDTVFAFSDILSGSSGASCNGGSILFLKKQDNGATVIKYEGTAASLTIPSSFMGVPVTSVDAGAAMGSKGLTSLVVSEGITEIQEQAFMGTSLTQVQFPSTLTLIDAKAFANTGLGLVLIPKGVSRIADDAFDGAADFVPAVYQDSYAEGWCSSHSITPWTISRLGVSAHSQSDIISFIKAHPSQTSKTTTFRREPTDSPYAPGLISEEDIENAVNMVNQIRYIAGLNADVVNNPEWEEMLGAAAMVNGLNGNLSHFPSRPEEWADSSCDDLYALARRGAGSSNLCVGLGNLANSVLSAYMHDSDAGNINRVGHRRWILNPSMAKTAFGFYSRFSNFLGGFSGMYVFDETGSGNQAPVAWPARQMPISHFVDSGSQAWSVSFGKPLDQSAIHVKLVRGSDGKTWSFSADQADGYFNVENSAYGQSGCVIFRPDGIGKISAGETFTVNITNDTQKTILEYTVSFFNI